MAKKPEQLIYASLRSLFTRTLPKGRWLLQRIETSTGTGIPDIYCSVCGLSLWIETKTTEFEVSNEQLNWAHQHALTGGLTYIVTRVTTGKIPAKTTLKHTPTTAHNPPNASSSIPTHATLYPQLPELLEVAKTKQDLGIVSYDQLTNSPMKKGQETLIFLTFEDRMRECSTLGSYLRKFNPDVLPIDTWLEQHTASRPSQSK